MFSVEMVIRMFQGERREIKFITGVGNLTNDVTAKEVTLKNNNEKTFVAGGFKQSIAFDHWENGTKRPVYFPIEAWGKTAENLGQLGKKGVEVAIIGRLENRSYKATSGEMMTKETLIIEKFLITSRSRDKANGEIK